jgi:uncharacterized protein
MLAEFWSPEGRLWGGPGDDGDDDMNIIAIKPQDTNVSRETQADAALGRWLAAAAGGQAGACFDLGVAFSTGSNGAVCDLIEAHKWFNLAAARGHEEAAHCRADIADEMTAREIAEAQRRARQWLAEGCQRAA